MVLNTTPKQLYNTIMPELTRIFEELEDNSKPFFLCTDNISLTHENIFFYPPPPTPKKGDAFFLN